MREEGISFPSSVCYFISQRERENEHGVRFVSVKAHVCEPPHGAGRGVYIKCHSLRTVNNGGSGSCQSQSTLSHKPSNTALR
jgi:hypothetical protein